MVLIRRVNAGFSLIEIVVAIFIVGLVMAGAVIGYSRIKESGRLSATKASLKNLSQAIELYQMEFNEYPKKLEDLIKPPKGGKSFLSNNQLPVDGWGQPFVYKVTPGKEHPYELSSYGSSPEEPESHLSVWKI